MGGFGFVVTVSIGAIFAYSGVAKLRAGRFVADLEAYRLVPPALVGPLAAVLPWVEVVAGLVLCSGVDTTPSLWVVDGLLTLFSVAMVVNLARGRRVSCGCQGTSRPISWPLVARNLALIGLTVIAAGLAPPMPGLRALAGSAALPASSAGALFAALVLGAVGTRLVIATRQIHLRIRDAGVPALLGGTS